MLGAIDASHIPIAAPELNHSDYYNRKGWYSMVIQAVVDHQYVFRDICVGWPGSVHDARIFANSSVYKRITQDGLLDGYSRDILGQHISPLILGDSAYSLQTWLMKPFTDTPNLSREKKCYHYHLSRARIVVENAFGRLKARWRRLMKRNDMNTEHIPNVISAACCVMHNICETHGESFNDAWLQDCDENEQPASVSSASSGNAAHAIRETLVQFFR